MTDAHSASKLRQLRKKLLSLGLETLPVTPTYKTHKTSIEQEKKHSSGFVLSATQDKIGRWARATPARESRRAFSYLRKLRNIGPRHAASAARGPSASSLSLSLSRCTARAICVREACAPAALIILSKRYGWMRRLHTELWLGRRNFMNKIMTRALLNAYLYFRSFVGSVSKRSWTSLGNLKRGLWSNYLDDTIRVCEKKLDTTWLDNMVHEMWVNWPERQTYYWTCAIVERIKDMNLKLTQPKVPG